jgi:hypothetical protein
MHLEPQKRKPTEYGGRVNVKTEELVARNGRDHVFKIKLSTSVGMISRLFFLVDT